MKPMYNILFVLSILFYSCASQSWTPSPETTFFVFDIDDVLSKPTQLQKPNLVLGGMWYYPTNSHNWIASLMNIKSAYKKDANGKREKLCDKDGNVINGLTFHFLYHGSQDKNLAHYSSFIVKTIESSRSPIDGTVEICHYLKQKGYPIVFATNKDRISYDAFAKTSGKSLIDIPDIVFVAQPGNNETVLNSIKTFAQQPTTPYKYKKLALKALTVQPTEIIKHAPSLKPNAAYYEYVHKETQKITGKTNMFFIDDKVENIDGVNTLQKDKNVLGIPFKNPCQLAQQLVKLGVLSKTEDQELLKKMNQYK